MVINNATSMALFGSVFAMASIKVLLPGLSFPKNIAIYNPNKVFNNIDIYSHKNFLT